MHFIRFLLISILLFSCKNETNINNEEKSSKRKIISKNHSLKKADSLVIDFFDENTSEGKQIIKRSISIVDSLNIYEFLPYLIDKMEKKYSCCPNNYGRITGYGNRDSLFSYMIVIDGKIDNLFDTNCVFFYQRGYQFRSCMPKEIWKKWIVER